MHHRTLLLNQGYEPLRVISWQRAISLCFVEKVQVVEEYDSLVRSPSVELRVPAVVRLLRYVHFRPAGIPFNRRNVFLRDHYSCQYCGEVGEASTLTLDHVLPRAQGGRTSWDNIVSCCVPCNREKGNRTPRQANLVLRNVPVRPSWQLAARTGPRPADPPEQWTLYLQAA